ncbi:MAG: hypothetical protein QXL51_00225 [Candidatus Aenigmatarchaeota archaeon]
MREEKNKDYLSSDNLDWLEVFAQRESNRLNEESLKREDTIIEVEFNGNVYKFKRDIFLVTYAILLSLKALNNNDVNNILKQFNIKIIDCEGKEVK